MKEKCNKVLNEIKVNSETGSKKHIEHFDDFKVRCLTYDKRTKKYQFKTHLIKDSKFLEKLTEYVNKLEEFPREDSLTAINFKMTKEDKNVITGLNLNCFLNRITTGISLDGSVDQETIRFDLGKVRVLDYESEWFDKFMRFLTSIRCGLGEYGVFIRLPFRDKTVDELERETTKFYKNINKIAKDVLFSRFSQRFTYVQEVNNGATWVYFDYKDLYYNSVHSCSEFRNFVFFNMMFWKEAIDEVKKKEYSCDDLIDFRTKFEEKKRDYWQGTF